MKVLLAENYFSFINGFLTILSLFTTFQFILLFGPISLEAHSFDFSDENADG